MKPALCFITYFPTADFFGRVELAKSRGYQIYIFDNTLIGSQREQISAIGGIDYQGEGENLGLGLGLHRLMNRVKLTHAWALYLDQDTWFDASGLAWIEHWLGANVSGLENFAAVNILAPKKLRKRPVGTIKQTPLMISSGTLFQLKQLEQTGWHNEKWFLECVDYEWCGRALQQGFSLGYVIGCAGFDHEVLQPIDTVMLGGKSRAFRVYSKRRNRQFLLALLKLFFWGVRHGQWKYAWGCLRNFLTHILNQMGAIVLNFIDQMKQR
jgi:rhamnosyltransferase